jgi:hypothetical protein
MAVVQQIAFTAKQLFKLYKPADAVQLVLHVPQQAHTAIDRVHASLQQLVLATCS